MLDHDLRQTILNMLEGVEHPREKAVDVMYLLQRQYGYLSDEALSVGAQLLGMTPLELEELATFYDFIYRRPVGKYVIHVCDGVVCWMHHEDDIFRHLCESLGVGPGETTADGMFTVLPTVCIGDCARAPSMLVNGRFYGSLTPERVDVILEALKNGEEERVLCP